MTNHVFTKLALYRACVFLSATFTSASRSDDDNDDLAPPVRNISVRIDQIKFAATSISSSESDESEICGSLNSKLIRNNITEENML